MSDVFEDLYDQMLYDPRVVSKLSHGVGSLGGKTELFWGEADDDVFFVIKMLGLDGDDIARALTFADYLAYIPYGERGYEAFDGIARTLGLGGAAAWRMKRFRKALGDAHASEEAMRGVQRFFDSYLDPELCPTDAFDITRAVCRLDHCFETSKLKHGESTDKLIEAMDSLCEMLENADGKTLRMSDVLRLAPEQEPLDDEQYALLTRLAVEGSR